MLSVKLDSKNIMDANVNYGNAHIMSQKRTLCLQILPISKSSEENTLKISQSLVYTYIQDFYVCVLKKMPPSSLKLFN